MLMHIDAAQGLGRGAEYWSGLTYDIKRNDIVSLSDMDIDPSKVLKTVPRHDMIVGELLLNTQIDMVSLLANFDTEDHWNYYLGNGYVGLILPNEGAGRTYNGTVEIHVDWLEMQENH